MVGAFWEHFFGLLTTVLGLKITYYCRITYAAHIVAQVQVLRRVAES